LVKATVRRALAGPPFNPVSTFKVLNFQSPRGFSDLEMEFKILDRPSWMPLFGLAVSGAMPDKNTIRHVRNRIIETGKLKRMPFCCRDVAASPSKCHNDMVNLGYLHIAGTSRGRICAEFSIHIATGNHDQPC